MRIWRRRPIESDPVAGLAELEAFLGGGSVEYFRRRNAAVPPWTWLNTVAHSVHAAVTNLCEPVPGRPTSRGEAAGRRAVETMATTLCSKAGGDPAAIGALQRELLIPLELALVAGRVDASDVREVARLAVVTVQGRRLPPAAIAERDNHDRHT